MDPRGRWWIRVRVWRGAEKMDTCGMHSTCLSSSRNSMKAESWREWRHGEGYIRSGDHQAHLLSCHAYLDSLLPMMPKSRSCPFYVCWGTFSWFHLLRYVWCVIVGRISPWKATSSLRGCRGRRISTRSAKEQEEKESLHFQWDWGITAHLACANHACILTTFCRRAQPQTPRDPEPTAKMEMSIPKSAKIHLYTSRTFH